MTVKVCALPYRKTASGLEVLSFLHPIAGCQFIKGTLEVGEEPSEGARRELKEESGLSLVVNPIPLGRHMIGSPALQWHFYAFETADLPNSWSHWTEDGGGHFFSFFWHPVDRDLDDHWHPIFHQSLRAIRPSLPAIG